MWRCYSWLKNQSNWYWLNRTTCRTLIEVTHTSILWMCISHVPTGYLSSLGHKWILRQCTVLKGLHYVYFFFLIFFKYTCKAGYIFYQYIVIHLHSNKSYIRCWILRFSYYQWFLVLRLNPLIVDNNNNNNNYFLYGAFSGGPYQSALHKAMSFELPNKGYILLVNLIIPTTKIEISEKGEIMGKMLLSGRTDKPDQYCPAVASS